MNLFKDGYMGTIYSCEEPEFVGCIPIRIELEVLPPDSNHPVIGWTIGKIVGINYNKYLKLLKKYLKKTGKSSEDDLTKEEIDDLYSKCEI